MQTADIARILHATEHGGHYYAHCPAHDDSNASLQITAGDKCILLHCFAGCPCKEIVEAMSLTMKDLRYTSDREEDEIAAMALALQRTYPKYQRASKRQVIDQSVPPVIYRYTDERGELLAEKMRVKVLGGGKAFIWRVRQPGGKYDYHAPKHPPIYRLHEVVQAQTVALVEGEKDADNLSRVCKSRRMAVTTAPNGAATWNSEYAKWFAGKKVLIFPDNDDPGRKYAEQALADISPLAKCVRIINLPVPEKEDMSYYLEGHTSADLKKLIMEEVCA